MKTPISQGTAEDHILEAREALIDAQHCETFPAVTASLQRGILHAPFAIEIRLRPETVVVVQDPRNGRCS